MKIIKTQIKDLILIKTELFRDKRGYFKEVEKFKVLKKKFIFDCFSYSKKNTLRGLHLQTNKSQAEIITVVHGKILDVAVDLRKKSPTYGKYFSIEISDNSDFSMPLVVFNTYNLSNCFNYFEKMRHFEALPLVDDESLAKNEVPHYF